MLRGEFLQVAEASRIVPEKLAEYQPTGAQSKHKKAHGSAENDGFADPAKARRAATTMTLERAARAELAAMGPGAGRNSAPTPRPTAAAAVRLTWRRRSRARDCSKPPSRAAAANTPSSTPPRHVRGRLGGGRKRANQLCKHPRRLRGSRGRNVVAQAHRRWRHLGEALQISLPRSLRTSCWTTVPAKSNVRSSSRAHSAARACRQQHSIRCAGRTTSFGADACVSPGQGTAMRFLDVTKKLGADERVRRRVSAHTGWRKISDTWHYLHAGCEGDRGQARGRSRTLCIAGGDGR